MLVVSRRLHRLRHDRVRTIGADDDTGVFVDHRTPARTSADADDAVVIPEQFVDGEPLPQFRARGHRRVSEELVQHDAAGCVGRVDTISLLDGFAEGGNLRSRW